MQQVGSSFWKKQISPTFLLAPSCPDLDPDPDLQLQSGPYNVCVQQRPRVATVPKSVCSSLVEELLIHSPSLFFNSGGEGGGGSWSLTAPLRTAGPVWIGSKGVYEREEKPRNFFIRVKRFFRTRLLPSTKEAWQGFTVRSDWTGSAQLTLASRKQQQIERTMRGDAAAKGGGQNMPSPPPPPKRWPSQQSELLCSISCCSRSLLSLLLLLLLLQRTKLTFGL